MPLEGKSCRAAVSSWALEILKVILVMLLTLIGAALLFKSYLVRHDLRMEVKLIEREAPVVYRIRSVEGHVPVKRVL